MIHTFVAYTEETDDAGQAIMDIMTRIDEQGGLCANTVGIIACHYEFIYSGVVERLCEALPFPVAGTIASAQAVNGGSGALLLTLTVLTGDELSFAIGLTPSLKEGGNAIIQTYIETASVRGERPALILTFAPFMLENAGDDYMETLSTASGGAPCFGTLAVDDTPDFIHCFSIYNGKKYRDRMVMVLVYGPIAPRFFVATISREKIIQKPAQVTKSKGHILMEVNGRPVVEYFEDLGLTKASETSYAMTALPFMLDYNDGTPLISKVFIGLSPERHAVCAGAMPEGATMYIGVFDKDDVLHTTGQAIDQAAACLEEANGMLVYSCISRNMTLGSEPMAEFELLQDKLGGKIPFMMANSGGEMCPTRVDGGKAVNRFHNNAFIACLY